MGLATFWATFSQTHLVTLFAAETEKLIKIEAKRRFRVCASVCTFAHVFKAYEDF
jgi:hypothetical protein